MQNNMKESMEELPNLAEKASLMSMGGDESANL